MENLRLSLKLGALEVEYEGPSSFAEERLMGIISELSELNIPDVAQAGPPTSAMSGPTQTPQISDSRPKLSTSDFAVKMGAKSGSDLTMAAAASLHHTRGLEDFRRSDILNEMKGAKAFFKASYGSNLSKSLEMLVKTGRLQNPRADTYALPYAEIENTRRHL
ncbi:hypothetical protein LGT41_0004735 [Abyssibius alkaniclasticus]|uniref:hypothetical protein n=1 Tax=Abyssibius alkaniclasticus TaxID=2881234 RepID=UPI0023644393|nr:hypothetical protein [Abyssibius alkaniclasticus]UPH72134.1 hypothetical protein LGT41_0004735 [Abyssibius alkaniclasticus]